MCRPILFALERDVHAIFRRDVQHDAVFCLQGRGSISSAGRLPDAGVDANRRILLLTPLLQLLKGEFIYADVVVLSHPADSEQDDYEEQAFAADYIDHF